MDLHFLIGAGGAPLIERAVEVLKVQFRLSSFTASLLALPLAIGEQYGLGFYFHLSPEQMGLGLATTLLTIWGVHEASK